MVVSRVDLEDFVKDYEEQSDRDKENFSRVSNKLLAKTFIVAELRDDKEDYYKSLELFKMLETYFSFIDYEVVKDEINKIIYIKTTKDHNRFHLNKFETILSLIFRLKYYQKKKEVTLTNNVYVELNEVMDEVNKTQIYSSPKTTSEIDKALRILRRNKIINFNDKVSGELLIEILPTIQIIVNINNMDELNVRIKSYIQEEESNDEEISED